ncbi:MAG: Fur family transcriptional regulator [Acidimicrobiales bacterium]|nr:Fur family transcriptional regulator [Acidimicrobiales bacterium]
MPSTTSPSTLHTTAAERLRRDGQRYTGNRRALVELLEGADRPLTIPDLLDRQSGIPQSSAYRNLAVLERAGVVERVVATDEFARFELAEDLTEHHHHLICSGCGGVTDFVVAPSVERRLDRAVDAIAAETGFRIEGHRFDLIGRCRACLTDDG